MNYFAFFRPPLVGETALVNSSSDAASAGIDIAIAVFTLLNAMGELDEQALTRQKVSH